MPKNVPVSREALHDQVADLAIELLLRKNHDYGNSWSKQGLAGVLVRLSDKFYRFQNLSSGTEAMIADEKSEDTLQDALAYCMLGLFYLRTGSFEEETDRDSLTFRFRSLWHDACDLGRRIFDELDDLVNLTLRSPKDNVPVFSPHPSGGER